MLIKYYTGSDITYTSRKRYKNIDNHFSLISSEEQRSVKLGDGAQTTVKTSVNNICDYVTIGDTRWFVHHYVYLNGGQIQLFLQRDVIGEQGLKNNNLFGKIERGYTDSVLKYRKELDLNQILTKRIPLKSSGGLSASSPYLNYYTSTHDNEKWGILYFLKNSEGKIDLSVNIPAFEINYSDYDYIDNNTSYITTVNQNFSLSFRLGIVSGVVQSANVIMRVYNVTINFTYDNSSWNYSYNSNLQGSYNAYLGSGSTESAITAGLSYLLSTYGCTFAVSGTPFGNADSCVDLTINNIASYFVSYYNTNVVVPTTNALPSQNYDGAIIKYTDSDGVSHYYKYSINSCSDIKYTTNPDLSDIINNTVLNKSNDTVTINYVSDVTNSNYSYNAQFDLSGLIYTYSEISAADAGYFVMEYSEQLIDEPYVIICCPLYSCTINKNDGSETYSVNGDYAQNIFNTLIENLSGDNAYIADAQVIPYAPNLAKIAGSYQDVPFFGILSSYFTVPVSVQPLPYKDIKKEYIQRQYSIIAPDQSDKFSFNFYDYVNEIKDIDGDTENKYNGAKLEIVLKFSLKPYAVISSAVIIPRYGDTNEKYSQFVLQGVSYDSDLRGCKPDNAGFEKSISTNQYEEYARSNSNYQQIFAKNQEYLALQNKTELVNETVSGIVNTVSAATMGAIAGASITQGTGGVLANALSGGAVSTAAQAGAAAAGAGAAGLTVAAASAYQIYANTELRSYEYNMQEQLFNLEIGTIKNLPNSLSRVSSFNEIILKDFYYVLEIYECTKYESQLVNNFINKYGYGIGVYDNVYNYFKEGWFLRGTLITSSLSVQLHQIADNELKAGIYYYEESEE